MVRQALNSQTIPLQALYLEYFVPAMSGIASNEKEQTLSIWREHIQSSIVRTLLEMCYETVMETPQTHLKALIFCLSEEYHELGARMTADFLCLNGIQTHFIGANTPPSEAISAIEALKPDLVCISVTNYYHLSKLQHFLKEIEPLKIRQTFKIAVGGYAIDHTASAKERLAVDFTISSVSDLVSIKEALL